MERFESPPVWKQNEHVKSSCHLNNNVVLERIGSQSTRAMVFHVVVDNQDMACKVLFDTELNSHDKNVAEVKISEYLGRTYPDYFQIIYYVTSCKNLVIPENIQNPYLMKEAAITRLREMVNNNNEITKTAKKKLDVEFRHKQDMKIYLDFLGITYQDISIPALLMMSELAYEDANSWLSKRRTPKEIEIFKDKVLDAIDILQRENITHNDLHLGNILMFDGSPKLCDFGEYLPYYVPNQDRDKFLYSLSKYIH